MALTLKTFMTEKKVMGGWTVDTSEFWFPEFPEHLYSERLYESDDHDFSCISYNILEYRMGSYAGLIGILKNKQKPELIGNPKNQWFDHISYHPCTFSDGYMFLRLLAYNPDDERVSGSPFVVFDLNERTFGFLPFDDSSCYYSIHGVQGSIFKLNLDSPNELEMMRVKLLNRHDESFDIKLLNYHPFENLDRMRELYFEERRMEIMGRK
jgi:hypothetical protein